MKTQNFFFFVCIHGKETFFLKKRGEKDMAAVGGRGKPVIHVEEILEFDKNGTLECLNAHDVIKDMLSVQFQHFYQTEEPYLLLYQKVCMLFTLALSGKVEVVSRFQTFDKLIRFFLRNAAVDGQSAESGIRTGENTTVLHAAHAIVASYATYVAS